ncbi:hypothetical protein DICPUDRAFT_50359 [Dictyostelium purpureum]|uniref:Enoyl reductase (ER) domain-containing protein n=1 Tax=Dictyostelium purpureum TaxID=5786 RepID=F0ZY36_DICPU|nr:uncharacterized protein DICPUDRAFT_50359 [Dictyostelium purpureum]EGC31139.1 hypothetical protein DICPUDRAFT_50359 [Dictyostelium purpureum]|eukprot:XP_003292327.1 hypothetical protein DICPUDRAFT_50359 [Dictyostelium purpureum]
MVQVKQILLKDNIQAREPNKDDFIQNTVEVNESNIPDDKVLVRLVDVSVDPYLRGRMSLGKSYIEPFKPNEPILSGCVAKIEKVGKNVTNFAAGDYVAAMLPWQEKAVVSVGKDWVKVDPKMAPLPSFLSLLGMTGLTAFHGLMEIGEPKAGETLVVSAGSGAVGSVVGQIGKILGLRVVGIAGSEDKIKFMVNELKFDAGINYKSPHYKEELAAACPKGVDVYFENVGGEVSDAVWPLLNFKARIPLCGVISAYNKSADIGPRLQIPLLKTSSKMQGFIVFNYADKNPQAIKQLSQWLKEGKIKDKHTVNQGFDKIVPSFLSLFNSNHLGKMVIEISKD